MQTGDKQGFGDPLYSTITAGNLVQTGNVTLGLTTDHYGRQSLGYKTNKMTVDVDNDDSTFNSSTGAFPNIPAGSKVKRRIYFGQQLWERQLIHLKSIELAMQM